MSPRVHGSVYLQDHDSLFTKCVHLKEHDSPVSMALGVKWNVHSYRLTTPHGSLVQGTVPIKILTPLASVGGRE
jgi:hypothetical protein